MAEAFSFSSGGTPPDILWTFPGQVSTDQDQSIYSYRARQAKNFVGVDVNARVAPSGSPILVDWAINGVINVNLRVTIAIGTTYGETIFAFSLVINDEVRPIVNQVGTSIQPGQSLLMRARGS